jgi:hypothetical protein
VSPLATCSAALPDVDQGFLKSSEATKNFSLM